LATKIAEHLPKAKRIQQGSYYTPEKLVERVHQLVKPYLKVHPHNAIVLDSAGGYGAFLAGHEDLDYRIAEYDERAHEKLTEHFDRKRIFLANSLIGPSRKKLAIPDDAFLIVIGNPPYNDTTSEFKKGQKGRNRSDPELFDRDLGISFLKSYEKLAADVVCILHPLAYLIKETNFGRLKEFKNRYRLIKGEIFSSSEFFGTGASRFPILIALYERHQGGMTFDDVLRFRFDRLDKAQKFVLESYVTTDGFIAKYPPRRKEPQISPIGLYYYTFRDLNSLKRNASFISEPVPNAIVVTVESFCKYAYLYALKKLFDPADSWLYGNLSPLRLGDIDHDRALYVSYALRDHKIFKELGRDVINQLAAHYGVALDEPPDLKMLATTISAKFERELSRMKSASRKAGAN